MSYQIEGHANGFGEDFEPTQPAFSLLHKGREIFEALSQKTPLVVSAFEAIQTRIPLPKTTVTSLESHFYRLPSQNRSFCYSLTPSDSILDAPVFVFKGAEPLLPDFECLVDWMMQAPLRKSSRVMADHFPLAEGKIPGVLSLREAIREADIALDVQKRHLKHYGELAKMPTPLLIHSISEQKRIVCVQMLRRKLSPQALERIEPLVNDGMAIYVYHYPSAPIRANYLGDTPLPKLRQYIEKSLDQDKTITGWVRLIVRLLYLGYLPYSVLNEGLGACIDFGNATLDGGICDPDSILPFQVDTDDEFFRSSVVQSLTILENTAQRLLDLSGSTALYPGIEEFACRQYIHRLINDAITTEVRPTLNLDKRFLKLMSPTSIADVKLCTSRKNRIGSYAYYAKRLNDSRRI